MERLLFLVVSAWDRVNEIREIFSRGLHPRPPAWVHRLGGCTPGPPLGCIVSGIAPQWPIV
jgi:hypothetical protein